MHTGPAHVSRCQQSGLHAGTAARWATVRAAEGERRSLESTVFRAYMPLWEGLGSAVLRCVGAGVGVSTGGIFVLQSRVQMRKKRGRVTIFLYFNKHFNCIRRLEHLIIIMSIVSIVW